MNIIDNATVSGLLVIVALAVVAAVVMLGIALRVRPTRQSVVRRTAAVAALILGVQVVAACGTDEPASDIVDPGAAIVKVSVVGSADAVERRTASKGGNRVGSADALERRLAVERSGACITSADAAERLGHAPCVG